MTSEHLRYACFCYNGCVTLFASARSSEPISVVACRLRCCTISSFCSTMPLQRTLLGIKSSLNRHLNSSTSSWKLLEQMLHPGLKNSNQRRGADANLKSINLIRIKGWGWRTVVVILAQTALIFFFPFYNTVKLNLVGKWVTLR